MGKLNISSKLQVDYLKLERKYIVNVHMLNKNLTKNNPKIAELDPSWSQNSSVFQRHEKHSDTWTDTAQKRLLN